jgi:predicted nucleotidyltransferase
MEELRQLLVAAVEVVLGDEPQVAACYLYGSMARDSESARDVDLALVPSGRVEEKERAALQRRVLLGLGRRLPGHTFDVRFLDELPTSVRGRVVTDGILVFERDPVARVRAEVAARMAYHDFLYFEASGAREALAAQRARLSDG